MSSERPLRYKKFYLLGGDVIFRVENLLFRVHSYFFVRESAYFRSRLLYASSLGEEVKQTSDDAPIVLDDCTGEEFTTFCWVFYNHRHSVYDATIPQWAAILRLADIWGFGEVKALALRELEKLEVEPVMRIHLYQKYHLEAKLLQNAFGSLATRQDALNEEEAELLGIKTFARVVYARELARSRDGGITPGPLTVSTGDLPAILARVGLSPLRTNTNENTDPNMRMDGPQSAPPLSKPPNKPSGNQRGGSMTVPQTPLESIPETLSSTSSESPPSYDKLPGTKQLNGAAKPFSASSWGSAKSNVKRT